MSDMALGLAMMDLTPYTFLGFGFGNKGFGLNSIFMLLG